MCYSRSPHRTKSIAMRHYIFHVIAHTLLFSRVCRHCCCCRRAGSLGGALVADMLAAASSCANNCRAGVCYAQTPRRAATKHQHNLLQQLWTKEFGAQQLHFQLCRSVTAHRKKLCLENSSSAAFSGQLSADTTVVCRHLLFGKVVQPLRLQLVVSRLLLFGKVVQLVVCKQLLF